MINSSTAGLIMAAAVAVSSSAAAVINAIGIANSRKRKNGTGREKQRYVKRVRNDRRGPFDLTDFHELLNHLGISFECYFRITREIFDDILEDIRPHLERDNPQQGVNASGHNITAEHRFAVAFRFFAGALWQDIVVGMQPISKAEVYMSVWLVVNAINNEYVGRWDYPRPEKNAPVAEWTNAMEFYNKIEVGFREKSPALSLEGVIGAIDGCILRVRSPGCSVSNAADYWCERKKTFGMLLMAVSDADMIIRN